MHIVKYKRISSVVLFVADAAGYVHLHQHTGRVCVAARGPYRGETIKGDVLVALDWASSAVESSLAMNVHAHNAREVQ